LFFHRQDAKNAKKTQVFISVLFASFASWR